MISKDVVNRDDRRGMLSLLTVARKVFNAVLHRICWCLNLQQLAVSVCYSRRPNVNMSSVLLSQPRLTHFQPLARREPEVHNQWERNCIILCGTNNVQVFRYGRIKGGRIKGTKKHDWLPFLHEGCKCTMELWTHISKALLKGSGQIKVYPVSALDKKKIKFVFYCSDHCSGSILFEKSGEFAWIIVKVACSSFTARNVVGFSENGRDK